MVFSIPKYALSHLNGVGKYLFCKLTIFFWNWQDVQFLKLKLKQVEILLFSKRNRQFSPQLSLRDLNIWKFIDQRTYIFVLYKRFFLKALPEINHNTFCIENGVEQSTTILHHVKDRVNFILKYHVPSMSQSPASQLWVSSMTEGRYLWGRSRWMQGRQPHYHDDNHQLQLSNTYCTIVKHKPRTRTPLFITNVNRCVLQV